MNRRAARSLASLLSESESDSEEIKLDSSTYLSNDKLSLPNNSVSSDNESHPREGDTIDIYRSQSDVSQNNPAHSDLTHSYATTEASQTVEAEYSEFDPELAESFTLKRTMEIN